uniref:Uncharacterized protein n=1 Tax=Marseillevirus LCMAC101 TaxID=2506602 RepID=A0A481YS03_9VIRU|nr:MAG: hypothetical protein LCMAC101_05630 [Marseillevirus LCMAC101]
MEEIKQIIREEIENADEERKGAIYKVREQIKSNSWYSKSLNFILLRMLADSSLDGNIIKVIDKLGDLTEGEHAKLWQFMLEQTENLKSFVQVKSHKSMDFIKQTVREKIKNANADEIVSMYVLRETFKLAPGFNRNYNFGIINGMMYSSPDKLFDVNSALSSLTNEEHSQLWLFILEQIENLKS